MSKVIAKILYPKVFTPKPDLALLWLRVVAIMPVFLKHGGYKLQHFSWMIQNYPNPVHIGSLPTFIIAFTSDVICSWLVMLGIGTRWAALYMFCNLFVGWATILQFLFWNRGNWAGEMMIIYMAVLITIVLAGPGKYSLDGLIQKRLSLES